MQYGIDKPREVLELYRKKEIKRAFRKSFDNNDPSILINEGEKFLNWHVIGDKFKDKGIDARTEFACFTAIFNEVTDLTRMPAEARREKKLDNIHKKTQAILKKMGDFDALSKLRAELERIRKEKIYIDTIEQQLKSYHERKCKIFMKEEWPYDIDESTFVRKFNFLHGSVQTRNIKSKHVECLPFIYDRVLNGPVICAGYYGMGKTTISKMLFKNWTNFSKSYYPVFISLTHRHISAFYGQKLEKQIANEIKQYLSSEKYDDNNKIVNKYDEKIFSKEISKLTENRKLLLFLDGIDESICGREDLIDFLNNIFTKNFLVFLTCRLEYRPFFDIYQALKIEKDNHTCLELCEWERVQWDEYITSLYSNYPEKRESIEIFNKRLGSGIYSTLPRRPLFLKMLSDLEIHNETGILIESQLASNLAEVYYKFIRWKIRDDYNRKGGVYQFDLEQFENDCFNLLRELAILEYQSIQEESETEVTLQNIQKICKEKKFTQITEDYISKILLRSSLFAILRRVEDSRFVFSHKSFMEFLVAFNLADCLFPGDMKHNHATCSDVWECFQTHEISRHFVNEVERIRIKKKLNFKQRNAFITSAFTKVINENLKKNLLEYNEKFQEVLYYIGKLEIESPELVTILENIIKNKEKYHPVYFRTASLSLSRIKGSEYCENYVLYLIKDNKEKGEYFDLNQDIQNRYYGEATLKQILKRDIDVYVAKRNKSSIISLKILTYFTAPKSTEKDKLFLNEVFNSAVKQKDENMKIICELLREWQK